MANSDDEWEDDESEQYALEIQGYSNSSEETLVFDLVSKMKIIGIVELSIGKTCFTKSKICQPVP